MRDVIILFGLFILALSSHGVILAGGDGTQNTNAPAGGQGWDYVGRITGTAPSSVTYIDNNWFITAYHIYRDNSPTGVLLGGATYSIQPDSWARLLNSEGDAADLAMFRVAEDVGLSGLAVRDSSPASGGLSLTMIGNGMDRAGTETKWDSSWGETSDDNKDVMYSGYKWGTVPTKRWGTNQSEVGAYLDGRDAGVTDLFLTEFDKIGGSEAQGATYDSGGGVFAKSGDDWELAGVMVGITKKKNAAAVYGDYTCVADLAVYKDQILTTTAIPEPSTFGLVSIGMGIMALARRPSRKGRSRGRMYMR